MAIVFDQQLGSAANTTAGTSLALTTANAVAAGGTIFLAVGWFHATGTLTSVTGGGLTWTIDKTIKNGSVSVALVRAYAAGGLAATTVLTANYSASSTNRMIGGFSFTGIETSSPVDTTASATGGTNTDTPWTAGANATINAKNVIIGVAMNDSFTDSTSTPSATWTEVPATAGDFIATGNGGTLTSVYRIVSATGTYTPGGNWSANSAAWAGVSVSYMEPVVVPVIKADIQKFPKVKMRDMAT